MNFKHYIKDKHTSIIIYTLETLLIILILNCFKIDSRLILLITLINVITSLVIIIYNYFRKANFYQTLKNNLNELDQKYLIVETLPDPSTYEEKIMINDIYEINKSMIENIKKKEDSLINFKEFIELWIHEVKIPISSLILKCHNHKDKYNEELLSIIRKLDNYIDEVLYYVRSEETEKDFFISEVNTKEIIKKVLIKNKDDLLENNINIEVNAENYIINTDAKWLEYIINQIINNSIKYKKEENSIIKINTIKKDNIIKINIYDNGIGIPKKDIKNIYNKSFTGSNGRNKTKSTGMGLYIVNNLISKLGHKINIESVENEYTNVTITFKNDNHYKM